MRVLRQPCRLLLFLLFAGGPLSRALIAEVLHLKLPHVLVVFGERAREDVRPVVAADEVQIVDLGRRDRRLQ